MGKKFQQVGLVALGAALGIAASLHFSAVADRQASALMLPVDDLRLFSEVFGRIKSDYVEPVEDKKLLKEAINGMLTGLDPHSAFLDQEAYRDLQVAIRFLVEERGMRVQAREHSVDGFLQQLLVFDGLDVVALDAAEHLAEKAKVVDRKHERRGLAVGDGGKVQARGNAERRSQCHQTDLLKLLAHS